VIRYGRDVFAYRLETDGRDGAAVSFLEPSWVGGHGLAVDAIVGFVDAAGISDRCEPTNLQENRAFLRLLSRVIWEEVGNDPAVCLDADVQGDGHVYLPDGRAPDPGGRVAAHDIVGSVTVANGSVVSGSFEHNPRHRLLTADGFFRLSPTLETALDSRLRSRTDYLYWPVDGWRL
jgi:hypothetical protein